MIAPLLVVWFGYDLTPKIVIVALVCFFPIVVPTLDALRPHRRRPAQAHALARRASRWQTFRLVEAPAALPGLVTGAKLSLAFAGIAAVLAEWAGSENGLGHLVAAGAAAVRDRARLRRGADPRRLRRRALRRAVARRTPPAAVGSPTERNHVTIRRLLSVLLLLAARRRARSPAASARSRPAAPATRARRPRPGLLPQRRPRRHLQRDRRRRSSGEARLDVKPRTPSDPSAPLKLLERGTRGPRDLLRARAAAGARQGRQARLDRRARADAADVDHLDRQERRSASRATLEGKKRRHRGHPLPGRVPQDDRRQGRHRPGAACARSTSASTSSRRC